MFAVFFKWENMLYEPVVEESDINDDLRYSLVPYGIIPCTCFSVGNKVYHCTIELWYSTYN